MAPISTPPNLGVRVDLGVWGGGENGTNRNVVPTFLCDLILSTGLSCTVWPQYTTRQTDRQSDGNIGRVCYSIGGLKSGTDVSNALVLWKQLTCLNTEKVKTVCHVLRNRLHT